MARSFADKQGRANAKYYSSKGKAIYSDFSTFAQGRALSKSNAIEFVRDFSMHNAPIIVCEYGVGKGDFAKNFLDEVKKQDRILYAKIRYQLFDISEKMLSDAKKNLAAHGEICSFGTFNAASNSPLLKFDYCRINELLSDLPAEIYSRQNGQIFDASGKEVRAPDLFTQKFLERIDLRRKIPFNFAAQQFLLSLCKLGKPNFRIDLFDYGFYSADDIFSMPVDEWNRVIARKYGSQITVDLNFLQLSSALRAEGFSVAVEMQKTYAEKVLGMPLEISHTKKGLDYVKKKEQDGSTEDDGFMHLQIGR